MKSGRKTKGVCVFNILDKLEPESLELFPLKGRERQRHDPLDNTTMKGLPWTHPNLQQPPIGVKSPAPTSSETASWAKSESCDYDSQSWSVSRLQLSPPLKLGELSGGWYQAPYTFGMLLQAVVSSGNSLHLSKVVWSRGLSSCLLPFHAHTYNTSNSSWKFENYCSSV